MEDETIFQQCSAEFTAEGELTGLLECLSDKHAEATTSLGGGVDTFFLIFAGALVFFMQTGFAVSCLLLHCTSHGCYWNAVTNSNFLSF